MITCRHWKAMKAAFEKPHINLHFDSGYNIFLFFMNFFIYEFKELFHIMD